MLIALISGRVRAQSDAQAAQLAEEGQQALARGDSNTAREDFEKLARLEPGVAEVHATLAAIDFQQRRYDEAIAQIHAAQKLKPGLPRLGSLLGLSEAAEGQYRQALPLLEPCFRQTADRQLNRLCGLQLLRVHQGLDQDADAVEVALALDRLFPDDPEVLYHTGRVFGSYAYTVMERLHDTAPNSVWMLLAQGEANESQKNYEAAIAAYQHVLVLDLRRAGIHYRLGRLYLARYRETEKPEDQQSALDEFQQEIALDPSDGNARYEVANLEAETGNQDQARAEYQTLVKQIPDFEEALVGLGGLDIQAGDFAAAAALLAHATELRADDEVAWYRLSVARRGAGDTAGQRVALATFRKLHSAEPTTIPKPTGSAVTPQTLDKDAQP
uniref:Uncharacterized protein n=1 Tax=mine drainage metagenome TaxID=410659 RepID=E6QMR3_9ZZZZ